MCHGIVTTLFMLVIQSTKKTQNINIKENDDKYHRRKITNKYKPYNTDNKDNQIIIVRIRTVYYTRFEENEASKQ